MPKSLSKEIDTLTAARLEQERRNPGCFWGTEDRLSRAEAEVFGIAYADFPRMMSVWEAWLEFLGLIEDGSYSPEAIARERAMNPELTGGNEPDLFVRFAMEAGGLTNRQADAMFWKEWFWTVREGHIRYADEPREKQNA